MKSMIAVELLRKARKSNPIFFGKLVVKLVVMMEYSVENRNSHITKPTNDGII